ncbi:MAG: CotH kinase family protein [Oscillospiraceae bacterium]|nr:CotH kinase family protein [Oscillospiraceae bacterium]
MTTNKHIDKICAVAVILALLICVLFMNGQSLGLQVTANAMGYEDRIFDTSYVHTIDIRLDDPETFLATCQSEEYTACDVVIDGEVFRTVGIRGKGNTSLSTVAAMDSQRYSFKLEFDQYDSTQSYHGLDKLSLNNLIQDNTMMKDYLTYQMMGKFGVAAPLCSFVYITINGEDFGLYLAVEAVEESFLQRNYGTDYGHLYKPDSIQMGGGRGNGQDFDFSALAQDQEQPQKGGMDAGSKGTDDVKLQYIDDYPESYSAILSSCKTDATSTDHLRLIQSLKALSSGDIDAVVDTDAVLRYFVVHNYVVNGDSYTGSMVHNYYLYEEDGTLAMIPWDYNLAFGTFQAANADAAVNDDIDAPLSVTGEGLPMIDWIWGSETYTQRYHDLFRQFLDTVDPQSIIHQADTLIAPYVEKDPTKFCTYEEYRTGVQTLLDFCELRAQSVDLQLSGEEAAVDTTSLTLSDMGTMSHSTLQSPGDMGSVAPDQSTDSTVPSMPEGMEGMMPGQSGDGTAPSMPEGMSPGQMPPGGMIPGQTTDGTAPSMPDSASSTRPNGMGGMMPGQPDSSPQPPDPQWLLLGATILILLAGLLFAWRFKR